MSYEVENAKKTVEGSRT